MAQEKIISLAEVRQAMAAKVADTPPARDCVLLLEVLSPDHAGGEHTSRILDAHVDPAMDAPQNLERYALALEHVAQRFRRAAAQRNAS